jgi:hypothetical protein
MPAGLILMFALATAPAAAAPVPAAKPASGPSAVPPELVTYCKTRKCRQNVNVVLRDTTGKPMRMQRALMPPAVEPDMVNVLPGEKVEFVADFKDGKFGGWRLPTPKDGASAYRITVQLDQHANDPGMTARVSSSGPKGLKFSMGVVKAETGAHPEGVSSCPVTAKGSTNETWAFPIGSLLIRDARTLEATDKVACE